MHTKLGLLLGIVLLLAACGGTPTTTPPQGEGSTTGDAATAITVRDPWVRAATMMNMGTQMDDHMGGTNHMTETEMGDMHSNMDSMDMDDGAGSNSAAYMVIVNSGATADAIVAATTDVAETVELHTVLMENGIMRMRPVPQIDIPANGEVELRPGGFHVMLLGIKQDLQAGETVNLTLTLQSGGKITVAAPVRQS